MSKKSAAVGTGAMGVLKDDILLYHSEHGENAAAEERDRQGR
jgi:hypothetical protein